MSLAVVSPVSGPEVFSRLALISACLAATFKALALFSRILSLLKQSTVQINNISALHAPGLPLEHVQGSGSLRLGGGHQVGLEAEDGGAPVLGPRSNKTPGVMNLAIGNFLNILTSCYKIIWVSFAMI